MYRDDYHRCNSNSSLHEVIMIDVSKLYYTIEFFGDAGDGPHRMYSDGPITIEGTYPIPRDFLDKRSKVERLFSDQNFVYINVWKNKEAADEYKMIYNHEVFRANPDNAGKILASEIGHVAHVEKVLSYLEGEVQTYEKAE